MRELVVARYNEDDLWVKDVESCVDVVTVYNKGDGTDNKLPNVGFECHTYLYHLFHRYDSLADTTVFVQGNPFDHPAIRIHLTIDDLKFFLSSDAMGYESAFKLNLSCDRFGRPHYQCKDDIIFSIWEELFKDPMPTTLLFSPCTTFKVDKQSILNRSRDFYGKAVEIASKTRTEDKLQEAFVFERLWGYIFNKDFK